MAITGAIAAIVGTGVAAQQSHAQAVHAGQDARDEATKQAALQAQGQENVKKTQVDQALEANRARQRALAQSYATTNAGVTTSNTGNVGQPNTAPKTLLGQ